MTGLRLPADKKIYLGCGALLVLLAIGTFSLFNTFRFVQSSFKITRAYQTVSKAQLPAETARALNTMEARHRQEAGAAIRWGIIGIFAALLFAALPMLLLYLDVDAKRSVEQKYKEASEKLQVWVEDLEKRNSEFSILNETADLLHTCVVAEESYGVVSRSCQKLFPDMQGGLYLINEEKNLVELVSEWNGPLLGEAVFSSDDCWALRRGRLYEVDSSTERAVCAHLAGLAVNGYLCVPMMGQGAALGFLHFRGVASLTDSKRRLVQTFAEQAALALGNLRLRQTLHSQSIRDPLTGLFNRRFMEEALERELRKAGRSKKTLATIMLDIDHFKKFNDLFGHEVGDQMLVELGQHIQRHIRDYDVPCRYGGEEFMILMPETSLEVATKRAEHLRKATKNLQLQNKGKLIGPVSLSLGIAIFPSHGQTSEHLFRAADTALYRAKSEGRDCVMVANSH